MSGQWRRVGDKASMYLPVLIMGLLALGTWWLVVCTPEQTTWVSNYFKREVLPFLMPVSLDPSPGLF